MASKSSNPRWGGHGRSFSPQGQRGPRIKGVVMVVHEGRLNYAKGRVFSRNKLA